MTKTLNEADLRQFTGTEQWYRHQIMRNVLYTDGARHVAEAGEAYWLLDEIATAQAIGFVAAEEFQVWKLTVNKDDNTADLVCEDGNDNVVTSKKIPFTDFPLPEITLWYENNTIMLPSER